MSCTESAKIMGHQGVLATLSATIAEAELSVVGATNPS